MFFIRKSMFLSSMRRPKRGNVHRMYPAKQPVACSLRIDRSLERHRAVSVTISITCTPLSGSECSDALIDVWKVPDCHDTRTRNGERPEIWRRRSTAPVTDCVSRAPWYSVYHSDDDNVMPNTHRRRRRDASVEMSRVGVGGVSRIRN